MDNFEFIRGCTESGYCTKSIAEAYVKNSGKRQFTENDFVSVYRNDRNNRIPGTEFRTIMGITESGITQTKTTKRYKQSCGFGSASSDS